MKILLVLISGVIFSCSFVNHARSADDADMQLYTERDRAKCRRQIENMEEPDKDCREILRQDDNADPDEGGGVYDENEDDVKGRSRSERLEDRADRARDRGNEERADRLEKRAERAEDRQDDADADDDVQSSKSVSGRGGRGIGR